MHKQKYILIYYGNRIWTFGRHNVGIVYMHRKFHTKKAYIREPNVIAKLFFIIEDIDGDGAEKTAIDQIFSLLCLEES